MTENPMLLIWLAVTLVALIIEVMTQQLVSIWFVVAGFVSLVMAWLSFPLPAQLVAFVAVSVASFALIRRHLTPYMSAKFVPTNADRLIGQEAVVTRDLPRRDRGEVRINGQFWAARCDDPDLEVSEGHFVLIRAIEGATLIVSPIDEE